MNMDTTSANRDVGSQISNDPRYQRRLDGFRKLLGDARSSLGLDFGFRLWDGSTVPADWPEDGMRVVIADESVIASLVRRPTLDTVIGLHVSGRLDLSRTGRCSTSRRSGRTARSGACCASSASSGCCEQASSSGAPQKARRDFSTRSRKTPTRGPEKRPSTSATSPTTTTSRTRSISSSSTRTWSTPAPTSSRTGTTISPGRSATSST